MGDLDVDASERKPSLPEVLERAGTRHRGQTHTMVPAVVVRYHGGRKVDIKLLIKRAFLAEDQTRTTSSVAVVNNVPVEWPGAGGYVFTCPISDGKTTKIDGVVPPATLGAYIVSERSLDKWLSGDGSEVDPEIDHTHQISDGVFVPELRPFGGTYPTTPVDHAVIGKDGGVQIHFRGTVICIGDEQGAAFIARGDKVLAELQKISGQFDSVAGHMHSFAGGAVGPPTAGAGVPSGTSTYTPSDPSASQGKVQ